MPTTTLTDEQQQALATRDVSVALSAGAGCGKTHVLTERFLSHVEPKRRADAPDPTRLHQLVAITFTDAAAREMRSRIRDTCYKRLGDKTLDEKSADDWLRILRLIETARISTIHSFCTSLLRKHAVEAGLDPGFGVLDQGEADVLQSDVIDEVLRERLAEHDPPTLDLAAALGLARLKQNLQTLLHGRMIDDPTKWLSQTPESVVAVWRDFHKHKAWPTALAAIANDAPLHEITALLQEVAPGAAKPQFVEAQASLLDLLPKLVVGQLGAGEVETIRACARVQGICTAKDWPDKAIFDRYSQACKALREAIDKHSPRPFNDEAAHESARLGLELWQLTVAVNERYASRKAVLDKLDFNDQLKMAHALLTAPHNASLREQLAGELALVLVDEFQDTDQLQAELITALCGDDWKQGRLFCVGDFKQSIYRFRGAQPDVFKDLRKKVPQPGQLQLTENFRSQPAILNFVNALFVDPFGKDFAPLRPNRKQATDEPSVEFLWADAPNKNSKVKGAADEARQREADWIARRLRALVDNGESEQPLVDRKMDKPRGVQPGDIAILFRALSDVQVYEEALRRYGLDYYLVGGHAYYAQQEIFDVLNLLRAVASTADEISLAGALRSPFFALEDETLYWLAEAGNAAEVGRMNAGLFGLPPAELSDVERAKVIRAAATIRKLRSIKDSVPIGALLQKALSRTGYDAVLLAEFLGQRKLANLQKLIERARATDHGGALDLDGFITQLSQFIVDQPKEALAATAAETADVIRLMTIHQAKGLQFPLVVVPDLDRPPRLNAPAAALDDELGPLVSLPSDDDREKSATGMSMFAARERVEELEERKRLLYVACTRAADHLILSSSLEACDAPKSDWMHLIAERFDLSTGALARQLPAGYDAPAIGVTLTEPATDHAASGKTRGPDILSVVESAQQLTESKSASTLESVRPVPADRTARRQFSFSRLTGQLVRTEPFVEAEQGSENVAVEDVDGFAEDEAIADSYSPEEPRRIDPREFGSLVHDVLERIDFAAKPAAGDIQSWCEHLAPLHVQFQEQKAAVLAQEMIERLVAAPRGRQIANAKAVHRELEFLLAWAGKRYLQGYIDGLYQGEDGKWRIVDYKTNDVSPDSCASFARRYEMQLYVYAMAAERALGVPPAELVLYFLRPGVEHVIPWNEAARQKGMQLVNDAIENLMEVAVAKDAAI